MRLHLRKMNGNSLYDCTLLFMSKQITFITKLYHVNITTAKKQRILLQIYCHIT